MLTKAGQEMNLLGFGRTFVALSLMVLVGGVALPRHAMAQKTTLKPNIIYILSDDQGWKDVGFHGSDIKTPNIDQLAQTGATFDNFYVQPMCTQTRAALMTGRYPFRYGLQTVVILPEQTYGIPTDEWLLPQALKEAGYTTALIGKWHLGHAKREYWPLQRGFDYHYGALIGEIDYFSHQVHGQTDWYRNNEILKEEGYVTTLLGQDAVKFINQHDPSKPLFMYLAFTAPHTPYQAPQEYIDKYKNIADPARRTYAAMITAMDDQIGKVVQALEQRGMRKNTLIIFHSDNGGVKDAKFAGEIEQKGAPPAENDPYRDGKGMLYEGGTRVVSLVNWPGKIKPKTVIKQMTHVVDYYPTLVGLAGGSLSKSKPLDGVDIWPTITQGKPSSRKEIVYSVEMFRAAVREGDWKLFWRTVLPSKIELYNLANDPAETKNLADKYPRKVSAMQNRILELAKQSSPSLFLKETFRAYMGRPHQPMALPNEDRFYTNPDEP
jgi:arylsulfatase A-like enzyme